MMRLRDLRYLRDFFVPILSRDCALRDRSETYRKYRRYRRPVEARGADGSRKANLSKRVPGCCVAWEG